MTVTGRTCDACHTRPVRNTRTLCDRCALELAQDIEALPDLIDELETTFTRQANITRNHGKTTTHADVIYDLRIAALRDRAIATLHHWAVTIGDGQAITRVPIVDWIESAAQQLAGAINDIVRRDDAHKMHHQITELARDICHAIDRPADRIYAGTCCDRPLYAKSGTPTATCRKCGIHHDVGDRRATMLAALDDMLLPAADIAGLVTYLGDLAIGRERTRKLINQWHARGRLAAHGHTTTGAPRFAFGETLALLARRQADQHNGHHG